MKTVYDFLRAQAALQITCFNCSHAGALSAAFLRARLPLYAKIVDQKYRCSRCGSVRVTLATASPDAVLKMGKFQHFRGIYEKYQE